jgi:hypothetical protein
MSFDIFLQCFRKGEAEPVPREMFNAIFGPHDTHPQSCESDPGYMVVEYPDGSGASIYTSYGDDDPARAGGFMFNHCGGESFWRDLYELADRSKSIIFWPSKQMTYVYTDEAAVKDVPEGAFDGGGSLVKSGFDIVAAIEKS